MATIDAYPYGNILTLHAARKGFPRNLTILIKAGADIEIQDSEGQQMPKG